MPPASEGHRTPDRACAADEFWAANGGAPAHPNWYYNLKARPEITVEVGAQTSTVLAQELDGTALAELWPKPAAGSPDLGAAQASTSRQFPVFLLTRQG